MHFEHLDCLLWPAPAEPQHASSRYPQSGSRPEWGPKMCFGMSWGRRYRIGKRRVVAGQQILGVPLRSEDPGRGARAGHQHRPHPSHGATDPRDPPSRGRHQPGNRERVSRRRPWDGATQRDTLMGNAMAHARWLCWVMIRRRNSCIRSNISSSVEYVDSVAPYDARAFAVLPPLWSRAARNPRLNATLRSCSSLKRTPSWLATSPV
jgi:hypothetical protein